MYKVMRSEDDGEREAARSDREAFCDGELTWGVMNRLAQAIRGFPDGRLQWWLCRCKPIRGKYEPEGPFYTKDEAVAARGDRTEFGVFGPFRAKGQGQPRIEPAPDDRERSTPTVNSPVFIPRVEKVVLTLRDGEGELELQGDEWDAVFWNLPAVEKFVIPYYVATEGLDKGIEVRTDFTQQGAYALVHAPDTDYVVHGVVVSGTKELLFQPI